MQGWIKLHRGLLNWDWADSPREMSLFVHLLLRANHKPTTWRGTEIGAGQLLTGRKQLSSWTGLTEQQIRTSLKHLKSTNELTIKSTKNYSIISIVNWDKYQGGNHQPNQELTNDQPTTNHIQECKNEKNEKNTITSEPAKADYGTLEIFNDKVYSHLLLTVKHKTQNIWVETYGLEFLKEELINAVLWLEVNPARKPKKNFAPFLGRWFARGWERHRKTIPTNKIDKPIPELLF